MNYVAEGHSGFLSLLALETTWLAGTGVKKRESAAQVTSLPLDLFAPITS